MAIVEIRFAPWSSKAALNIEISDSVKPIFHLRAALELVVGEVKEGKRDRADLRGAVLSDAVLRGADLSGADLRGAVLRGAVLSDAVLSDAVLSGADLRGADLSGAVLSDAVLSDAVLRDADLRGAVLSDAVLRGADLSGAVLSDAVLSEILEKEVPLVPNIDAAVLKIIENSKGLDMGGWHGTGEGSVDETNWCKTTHCRAGAAVCAGGKEGFALEAKYGAATAGMLLYMKSTPDAPIPDFYCSEDKALADIKARAARQTAEAHLV